jgi:hypothetical protein
MPFVMLTSIKGRRLGLSSTGGIVSGYNSTGGMSTAIDLAAVMRDSTGAIIGRHYEPMTTISSSGATLQEGLNYITSATGGAAYAFSLPTALPGMGVICQIWSSASTITFSGSATTILFNSTVFGGTTSMVLSGAGGNQGTYATFRAVSTAKWGVDNKIIAIAATGIVVGMV